jgi:excisionase family DNA binding protein
VAKKNEKNLNKTYWEWQRYKQKETQRLLKKLTDQKKIHHLDADGKPDKDEEEKEYTQVDEDIDTLFDKKEKDYNAQEHLRSVRGIKPLGAEFEDTSGEPIDEAALVGPYDDPAAYEAKKAAASRAEKVVTKKRGRKKKKKTEDEMSLFNKRAYEGRIKAEDPKKKREELIESLLDPLITLEDAATILNVCKTTVRRYTNKGVLECIRTPGGQRRFKLSHVLDFMALQGQKKARKASKAGKSSKED